MPWGRAKKPPLNCYHETTEARPRVFAVFADIFAQNPPQKRFFGISKIFMQLHLNGIAASQASNLTILKNLQLCPYVRVGHPLIKIFLWNQ
jgi:hypothetical protein